MPELVNCGVGSTMDESHKFYSTEISEDWSLKHFKTGHFLLDIYVTIQSIKYGVRSFTVVHPTTPLYPVLKYIRHSSQPHT